MTGSIVRVWRNGRDTFSLASIGSILDLEQQRGSAIALIYQRLLGGVWYADDVREPIRISLIGGGMTPERAQEVVDLHVRPPLADLVLLAADIVASAIVSPEGEEQPGKPEADRGPPTSPSTVQTGDFPGSPFTTSPENSDGIPGILTGSPSGSSPPSSTDTTRPTP